MNIVLLTHCRELNKKSNTGSLVARVLADACRLIVWGRVSPDLQLLDSIEHESVALLYPSDEAELLSEAMHFDSCIIIDGTWQEAQKIYNKSPYLQTLPRLKIAAAKKSIYSLRRNQKESGLCTAECAAEVLKVSGHLQQANEIEQQLIGFIEVSKLQTS